MKVSSVIAIADPTTSPLSPMQQNKPGDAGAGPTSRAPEEMNHDAAKNEPVMTHDKGVTTTTSGGTGPKSNAPLDRGNDSFDTVPERK